MENDYREARPTAAGAIRRLAAVMDANTKKLLKSLEGKPGVKIGPAPKLPGDEDDAGGKVKLCEPSAELINGNVVACMVPVVTRAEANGRDWRERSKRTKEAFKAVGKYLSRWRLAEAGLFDDPYIEHHGGHGTCRDCGDDTDLDGVCRAYYIRKIHCKLTRMGGKKLDRTVNLPSALKAVEDAVCFILGIDDGEETRWHCTTDQIVGTGYGVRIELWSTTGKRN